MTTHRAALCVALAILPGLAAAQSTPSYVERLRLPYRTDDLGFSRSVHSDLHAGETFVCDFRNNRLAIFDAEGRFRYQIRGGKIFGSPHDVAVDPEGYIFLLPGVGDHLLLLDFDGLLLEEIPLHLPADVKPRVVSIALSPDGSRLYALDQASYHLWILDRAGGVVGSVDWAEGLSGTERRDLIFGHVDAYADTVLVAIPSEGRVHLLGPRGERRGQVGLKGTANCKTGFPVAAALDSAGRVLIVDNQRAVGMIWDPETNKCLGQFSGFGNAPGAVYRPLDLSLDGQGRVFLSQGFEGRVQVFQHDSPAAGAPQPEPEAAGD